MSDQHGQGPSGSQDVSTARYHANSKSMLVSYLLWFFLGGFGVHRFYLGRTGSGVAMLILFILGWALSFLAVGFLLLIPVGIWLIVDIFLIPGIVRQENNALVDRIAGGR